MQMDSRFILEEGRGIFTGNELLLKGALETAGGVHLLGGYPGSPISGFFDAWQLTAPLLREKGIVARMANNEALAVAMANGVQMAGGRAMVAMKNVGLHVASDALALGVLAGTKDEGGVLVVCGEDPWSDSTQVPADSRFLSEHLRMPILEPSTPQEVKDWVEAGFKLCRAGQIYVGYMMPVALADGGGSVELRKNHYPQLNTHQRMALQYDKDIEPDLEQFVLLPPRTWQRELSLQDRHDAVCELAHELGLNRIEHRPQRDEMVPLGFVAAGSAYAYLVQALDEMGLSGRFPILKMGLTYPLDTGIVHEMAACCRSLIVVEERRSFLQRQIESALSSARQQDQAVPEIWGKEFPGGLEGFPATRGLHPSIVIDRLSRLFQQMPLGGDVSARLQAEQDRIESTGTTGTVGVAVRTPTFCPGCPHRDSAAVLLELRQDLNSTPYMSRRHKAAPVDLVAHGDTGCYTMLMFEPYKPLMHNYSGMGLGGATGAGIDPFITNKQIVFMGDGTFFHSGQIAIGQSISIGQDITYLILDNSTTAMTGQQPHSGSRENLVGESQTAIEIERMVRGMIPHNPAVPVKVIRMNPAERADYREALERTILSPGVKIVIADKECGIQVQRRVRSQERRERAELGFLPRKSWMNITSEVCEYCLECTRQTGCPGLTITPTDLGPKIQTDLSSCVNDGACTRVHACPSFEEVTVFRNQPPRRGDEHVNLYGIPDAPRPLHADQDNWRCYLAGVGGMGIGTATAILVTAGHAMGYHVNFLDKKGLAIRNGGVFSQIVFTRNASKITTPLISFGKADLLIGLNPLEAARAIDSAQPLRVASPDRTCAVINTSRSPTVYELMGREEINLATVEQNLRQAVHRECYFGFKVGDLCERMLDSKLYSNVMMLGMAYQLGYLPLTIDKIEQAVRQITRGEAERNLRAFHIGRKIIEKPEDFKVAPAHEIETARQAIRRRSYSLRHRFGGLVRRRRGARVAQGYRDLVVPMLRAMRIRNVDDRLQRDLVARTADCMVWGGMPYAKRYADRVMDVFRRDETDRDFAMTRAVAANLAKVMLIKDEPYVAALLTSPEKYQRDRRRFNVNPARGDRITYRHFNRPEFVVFGHSFRFEWTSRPWQLWLMARCRWLRNILPGWHRQEIKFRDWYEKLVDRSNWKDQAEYDRWVAVFRTPERVSGFRDVRYPRQDAARARAEALINGAPLAPDAAQKTAAESGLRVSLTEQILQ